MVESPFTLSLLGKNEYLINYEDEVCGPELEKLAINLIRLFLDLGLEEEFFKGIFDNDFIYVTSLSLIPPSEENRNIKLWFSLVGLRVDTDMNALSFWLIFEGARGLSERKSG